MSDAAPNQFRDPVPRNYLVLGLAGILVVSAVMFLQGGPTALIPGVVALLGLLLRWTAMPIFFLFLLAYFLVFPFGAPDFSSRFDDVAGSHLRVLDLALVGGVLTYFVAQFRLLSLVHQSMPFDRPGHLRKKSDKPTLRPETLVGDGEIVQWFWPMAVCLVLGQVAWFLISEPSINFLRFPPFDFSEVGNPIRRRRSELGTSPELTRFFLFVGLSALVGFALGIVLRYWRLVRISRDEARMILLDAEWTEARRELNRQEKWRDWALPKLKLPGMPEPIKTPSRGGCGRGILIFLMLLGACALLWCVAFGAVALIW